MAKIKLIYFNGRGRAEIIRWLLAMGNMEYENVRLTQDEWPNVKPTAVFEQLPMLEYDGVKLAQTRAICRFLAKKAGLAGKDDIEQCRVDMIIDHVYDFFEDMFRTIAVKDEVTLAENKKKFIEEKLPKFIRLCTKVLKENGNGFFVGNAITWADIEVALFLSVFTDPTDPMMSKYFSAISEERVKALEGQSELCQLIEKVKALPQIKAWMEKRPSNEKETF